MDLYSPNPNSQPYNCCGRTPHRFCNDRHFPKNGSSNNPVYGTIGNGKNFIRKNPNSLLKASIEINLIPL